MGGSFRLSSGVLLMIGGGIAAIAGVFLPWVSLGFISVTGLQILQAASQIETGSSAVTTVAAVGAIGIVGVVCGLLVGAGSALSGLARGVAAVAAGAGLAYGAITVVDLVREANDISGTGLSVDVLQFLGIGIWVAAVGGLAIVLGALMGGPRRQAPPQAW